MKIYLSFMIAGMLTGITAAQPPDTVWTRTYGSPAREECYSAIPTTDGGFVLAGFVYVGGDYVARLVKTDANGDTLWSGTYGGGGFDVAYAVLPTGNGNYLLAGETTSSGVGGEDMLLVRVAEGGENLWSGTYGGSGHDVPLTMQQTGDHGHILAGFTQSFGVSEGDQNMWLVKTARSSELPVWSRTFGGDHWEWAYAVQQTSDSGFIVAGYTGSFGAGSYDMWLVKTDTGGDSLWSRTFGGSRGDYCLTVQQTSDGGFILAGSTYSFGAGSADMWLVKTDANGDSLWSRTFGGSRGDVCVALLPTDDGGYLLAGNTDSFGAGGFDIWLVRTDANGDSLWSRTLGGGGEDVCQSLQQTDDGGYILAGYTTSYGAGGRDMWLVRVAPELGVEHDASPAAISYLLHPPYPNPCNASTVIAYDLPRREDISLRVLDVLGRDVALLQQGRVEAGAHRVRFDGSGLAAGIYFVRLTAGEFVMTQKVVLLK